MKKLICALSLLGIINVCSAETSAFVGLGSQTDNTTGSQTIVKLVNIGTSITKNIAVDFWVIDKDNLDTNVITDRFEPGITLSEKVGELTPFIRFGVGEKQKSGAQGFYYYTAETGSKYDVTKDLTVKASYYYRQSFDDYNLDQSQAVRLSTNYKLTQKDSITVGYFYDVGGYNTAKTIWAGYSRSF